MTPALTEEGVAAWLSNLGLMDERCDDVPVRHPAVRAIIALVKKERSDEARRWISCLREYAVELGIDVSREGDEPGQIQVMNAILALKSELAAAIRARRTK